MNEVPIIGQKKNDLDDLVIGLAMSKDGPAICAGYLDRKKQKWKEMRNMTKSCVEAVRDMFGYYLMESQKEDPNKKTTFLTWDRKDGQVVVLQLSVFGKEDLESFLHQYNKPVEPVPEQPTDK